MPAKKPKEVWIGLETTPGVGGASLSEPQPKPSRKITAADKLAESNKVATLMDITKKMGFDVEVLQAQVDERETYHAIRPMINPTAYRSEHRVMDAMWDIIATVIKLKRAVDVAVEAAHEANEAQETMDSLGWPFGGN